MTKKQTFMMLFAAVLILSTSVYAAEIKLTAKDRAAYWDGRNQTGERVASGVYFYTIQAGSFRAARKMTIAR